MEGSVRLPPVDDGTTCCGAASVRVRLTSPMTNQPVEGIMTPNRIIEAQIVDMIEKGTSRATPEELEEWHRQREKKKRSALILTGIQSFSTVVEV